MDLKPMTSLLLAGVMRAREKTGVAAACRRMISSAGGMSGLPSGVATDRNGDVTRQMLDGLFTTIAVTEKRIRENPAARSTNWLNKCSAVSLPDPGCAQAGVVCGKCLHGTH